MAHILIILTFQRDKIRFFKQFKTTAVEVKRIYFFLKSRAYLKPLPQCLNYVYIAVSVDVAVSVNVRVNVDVDVSVNV